MKQDELIKIINDILKKYNINRYEFAALCGLAKRTVDGWYGGRIPSNQSMKMIENFDAIVSNQKKEI